MHELSITQSILYVALENAKKAEAGRIGKINITVGELSGIVEDCVRFYFDFLSRDTIAAGASLEFSRVPTRLRCRSCGTEFSPGESRWVCPACQQQKIDILYGRECSIESIEVE
jgi:hydrogenase nickel incorporation protein HypA/HybF